LQLFVLFPFLATILLFIVMETTVKNIFKVCKRANTNIYVWYKLIVRQTPFSRTNWRLLTDSTAKRQLCIGLFLAEEQTALMSHIILTQHTWLNSRRQWVCWSLELDTKLAYSVTLSHHNHMVFEPWGQLYSAGMLGYPNQVFWNNPTSISYFILTNSKDPSWNSASRSIHQEIIRVLGKPNTYYRV
jgi:hypothetical protein